MLGLLCHFSKWISKKAAMLQIWKSGCRWALLDQDLTKSWWEDALNNSRIDACTHILHACIYMYIYCQNRQTLWTQTGLKAFNCCQHGFQHCITFAFIKSWIWRQERSPSGREAPSWVVKQPVGGISAGWSQQLPKRQQPLMSKWQRLMEIQVAGITSTGR